MERYKPRPPETQIELMLSGFRMVLEDSLREDLEPQHREIVKETLAKIATYCVDAGLGLRLAEIQNNVICEYRLTKLKKAWESGEIAL